MSFVQNTVVPVHLLQVLNVVPDHIIRHDHNIVLWNQGPQSLSLSGTSRVHDRLEVVGVLENLVVPMASQGWGANHQ